MSSQTVDPKQVAASFLTSKDTKKISFDWGNLTWFASGELGNTAELTAGICRIKPGMENPLHYHPTCSELLVVLEGTIVHSIGDSQPVTMNVGDTLNIPAGMHHNAKSIGDREAVLFVMFPTAQRTFVPVNK
jgi:quercetin dioxygenase-like cupin family protein